MKTLKQRYRRSALQRALGGGAAMTPNEMEILRQEDERHRIRERHQEALRNRALGSGAAVTPNEMRLLRNRKRRGY